MTDEARKARNRYIREYRRRNPERVKQWEENQWRKKAAEYAAADAAAAAQAAENAEGVKNA